MAIAPVAEAIIPEHKYGRVRREVLLPGRQAMQFSPQRAADRIRAVGLIPSHPRGWPACFAVSRRSGQIDNNLMFKAAPYQAAINNTSRLRASPALGIHLPSSVLALAARNPSLESTCQA